MTASLQGSMTRPPAGLTGSVGPVVPKFAEKIVSGPSSPSLPSTNLDRNIPNQVIPEGVSVSEAGSNVYGYDQNSSRLDMSDDD